MFSPQQLFLFATCICFAAADLKADFHYGGIEAVFPGDPNYASASSAFNRRFNFKPAAVTFPRSAEEVSQTVKIGVKNKMKIVPRSGGHSYIANGLGGRDGSLVIDLKHIRNISLDENTSIATVGTGNRLGNVALALTAQNRDVAHGTCPYVGIGGHASYGGFGHASRMWGLALDEIVGMDVVTANGAVRHVSRTSYPDLFWAMRGAGGSFSIATAMYLTTHEIPPAATRFRYNWVLNVQDSADALSVFQDWSAKNAPAELGIRHELRRGPSLQTVAHSLTGTYHGSAVDFEQTMGPLLARYPPNSDRFVGHGSYFDSLVYNSDKGTLDTTAPDVPNTFYAKSLAIPEGHPMKHDAIVNFVDVLANQGQSTITDWFIQVELWGGNGSAINLVPSDATSFALRSSLFIIQFYASAPGHAPPYPQEGFQFLDNAVESITSKMPKNWDWGAYTDYIDDHLSNANWQQRYYGANYPRLQALKRAWDRDFVFGDFPTGIDRLRHDGRSLYKDVIGIGGSG